MNIKNENYRSSKLVNESYIYTPDESMICQNFANQNRRLDKFRRTKRRGPGYFDSYDFANANMIIRCVAYMLI